MNSYANSDRKIDSTLEKITSRVTCNFGNSDKQIESL